jgi:hypothetical protein
MQTADAAACCGVRPLVDLVARGNFIAVLALARLAPSTSGHWGHIHLDNPSDGQTAVTLGTANVPWS